MQSHWKASAVSVKYFLSSSVLIRFTVYYHNITLDGWLRNNPVYWVFNLGTRPSFDLRLGTIASFLPQVGDNSQFLTSGWGQ